MTVRISVTRTGGLTGRTLSATLETAGRPDADRLHTLAAEALRDARGEGPASGTRNAVGSRHTAATGHTAGSGAAVPDGYRYAITAGGTTAHCADPHVTTAQRALIRAVLRDGT